VLRFQQQQLPLVLNGSALGGAVGSLEGVLWDGSVQKWTCGRVKVRSRIHWKDKGRKHVTPENDIEAQL
jgi:hypothetical protein